MSTKICLSIQAPDNAFTKMQAELSRMADVNVVGLEGFSLQDVDILIGKSLSTEALATADRLRAVFAYKTGVDNFPLTALRERGIELYNTHADSAIVAEYAFGLAVALVNRIVDFDRNLRQGVWHDANNPYWRSLFSMKAGLVGFGCIGSEINRILRRNGMKTFTIDRGKEYIDVTPVPSLDALIDVCDILFLSLPKVRETDGMFDRSVFERMYGKYLVNVGRSNCIVQKDLYESLRAGILAGAANDTWDAKPKNIQSALKPSRFDFEALPNMILSPHAAMRVEGGHERYVEDVTQNIKRYLSGRSPINRVDLVKGY